MSTSFDTAYKITARNESGYAHVDGDTGEETYNGISRKWFPHWPGWAIVDAHKPLSHGQTIKDARLEQMEKEFYHVEFWNKISGDKLPSQDLANQAYDQAVNGGVPSAKQMLRSVGIVICMLIMLFSASAQNNPCQKIQRERDSLMLVTQQQGVRLWRIRRYVQIVDKNRSQAKFLRGWIKRAL